MFTSVYTDQGVVRKVLSGNRDAFRVLLERYGHMVYGVAYARVGNASDAEEITQATFVRLYQWLDRVAGRKTVGPWLVEVARNGATDVLRRRAREAPLEAAGEGSVAAHDHARDELRRLVWEQLSELDDTHREVLILHYFQGVKIREIGHLLGISRDAAAKRLQRSRDELGRRMLDAVGVETAGRGRNTARARRVMSAIAGAPACWQPSPALSVGGAAVVGASAAKVVAGAAAAAILIAIGLYAGWRHINRPYDTQNITEQSEFTSKPTELRQKSSVSAQPAAVTAMDTTPAPSTAEEAIAAAQKACIYGVVLDESLKPVGGATVRLDNEHSVGDYENMLKETYIPYAVAPIDFTTTSGNDGSFCFESVGATESYLVGDLRLSAAKGSKYAEKTLSCKRGQREQYVEIVIGPSASLTVRVVDEAGRGVPKAEVTLWPGWDQSLHYRAYETGADGVVQAPLLMAGPYRITARREGYGQDTYPTTVKPGHQTLLCRLALRNSISGRLTFAGDGTPIAGVKVCTFCVRQNSYYGTTDGEGRFQIDGLAPDTYELMLAREAAPYVVAESPKIDVAEGRPVTGVEVEAVEGAYVSGSTLDEKTNEPMPRVMIRFGWRGGVARGTWPTTYSDEHGRYLAGPLLPDTYDVMLLSESGDATHRTFTVSSFQNIQGVDFKLKHHFAITGTVVNAGGEAVPGASVVTVARNGSTRFAITDAGGRFLTPAAEGLAPYYAQAFSRSEVSRLAGPLRGDKEVTLRLEGCGRIEGTVVDLSGRPQPGMLVAAAPESREGIGIMTPTGGAWYPKADTDGATVVTSASGSFQMGPVAPGKYELQVYAESSVTGYPAATARAVVSEGETLQTRLVLDTSRFAAVEGQVLVDGEPGCGIFVYAGCEGENWVGNVGVNTDSEGYYELLNLRPGKLTVSLRTHYGRDRGRMIRSEDVNLAAGETARVDFAIGETGCGFEGFVKLADVNAFATLTVMPAGSAEPAAALLYETDNAGHYRIADLAEGAYDIEVRDLFDENKLYATALEVEARANEVIRMDFEVGAGFIEGTVAGVRKGEVAHVAVFAEDADFSAVTAALGEAVIASATVGAGEGFRFEQLPPGIYYVGAAAVAADRAEDQTAVLEQVGKGRFAMAPVEVFSGEVVAVDLVLP